MPKNHLYRVKQVAPPRPLVDKADHIWKFISDVHQVMPPIDLGTSKKGNPVPVMGLIATSAWRDILYADGVTLGEGFFAELPDRWLETRIDEKKVIIHPMPHAMQDGSVWRRPEIIRQSENPKWFAKYKHGTLPDDVWHMLASQTYKRARRGFDNALYFEGILKVSTRIPLHAVQIAKERASA